MIDLDKYLRRIGYAGPREPTLPVLADIAAAHPAAIAFENIDPLLGRTPSLALTALQAKLVDQRRGGYCFEHNTLLRCALSMLGMNVTALSARVVFMGPPDAPPRARSHMLLKVELPDSPGAPACSYIVDAGFGGHVLGAPLRFELGLDQPTATGAQRITRGADGYYAVEASLQDRGWSALYRYTLEPQLPIDYEPLNWFTATHPTSMFRHNLLLERLTHDVRASMFNDRLVLRRPGEPPQERSIETASDFAQVLDSVFDIQPPVSAAELFERVPKGLEGIFIPTTT
jgi:N-hydroxyarylamine O-acetyltransferase